MKTTNPSLTDLFKTPRRKTYTLVGITILTVGIFGFFALRPTFVKIADLNAEINDKQEFLEKVDKKLTTVNDLISQKQSVSQELVYFGKALPTEEKSGFLVANLAAIAEQYDVDLMSVESDKVQTSKKVNLRIDTPEGVFINQVSVNIEGEVRGIEQFVKHLETFPRTFDIKTLSYQKNDPSQADDLFQDFKPYSANIVMYVYYWNESADVPINDVSSEGEDAVEQDS